MKGKEKDNAEEMDDERGLNLFQGSLSSTRLCQGKAINNR